MTKAERKVDPRWPNEPCGTSLEQCPYDKSEHTAFFEWEIAEERRKDAAAEKKYRRWLAATKKCPTCKGKGRVQK